MEILRGHKFTLWRDEEDGTPFVQDCEGPHRFLESALMEIEPGEYNLCIISEEEFEKFEEAMQAIYDQASRPCDPFGERMDVLELAEQLTQELTNRLLAEERMAEIERELGIIRASHEFVEAGAAPKAPQWRIDIAVEGRMAASSEVETLRSKREALANIVRQAKTRIERAKTLLAVMGNLGRTELPARWTPDLAFYWHGANAAFSGNREEAARSKEDE